MSVVQRGVLTLVFKGSIYVSGTEGCADLRVPGDTSGVVLLNVVL